MKFSFLLFLFPFFPSYAIPDTTQASEMACELMEILNSKSILQEDAVRDSTYIYMRKSYPSQLALTGKNKTLLTPQSLLEANNYLYQLDTMGRKTIIFLGYAFYSAKVDTVSPKKFIDKMFKFL